MYRKVINIWRVFLFLSAFSLIVPPSIFSASLRMKHLESGPKLHFQLQAEKIEKLAGLKVSLTYPEPALHYESAAKTTATSSFMHVVNDKLPGKLIIVMASAQGISGSNVPLFDLTFSSNSDELDFTNVIYIAHCQLMTEDLKEVPCELSP